MVGFITIPYEDEKIKKLEQDLAAAYACIKDLSHRVSVEDFMSDTDQNIYNDILEKHKEIISKARENGPK